MGLLENAKYLASGLGPGIVVAKETPMANLLENCKRLDYDPDQPRDENGRFGEGSGSSHTPKLTPLKALDPGDYSLSINEKGEIWAARVKKNGKLSDASSKLSREEADKWVEKGEAYYTSNKSVPSELKELTKVPYGHGMTREQYTQKAADEGKDISQRDWDYAMNRDT